MIPANFTYKRASSVDEALQMLQSGGDDAKLLAGGHSLIAAMKLRLNEPGQLIDISQLSELRYIREEGNDICIGAATTHAEIVNNAVIGQHLGMMTQAGALIGDMQVRNMGTLGGSIAHADPAADWPASLLAAGASISVKGAGGSRTISAGDFFQGLYMTALQDGEIITEVRVPKPAAGTSSAYEKFMQPASRFAIVGCAAMVTMSGGTCQDVKVAFTGVSDVAFRDSAVEDALRGKSADAANIEAAANMAAEGVDILSDHFASEKYRKHLAKVYAKRALMAACS